jgi:MoaA/NifB/PqqE/SkfB family radical SAM enzyme
MTALSEKRDLEKLLDAFVSTGTCSKPEESAFKVLFADITHRCNMACNNCYIPVRDLPDLPIHIVYDVLQRLPRRTQVRLIGAEPTVRSDLPQIIIRIRELGHIPVLITNGLRLSHRAFATKLKSAGLRSVSLSLNGGLKNDLYQAMDSLACADRKLHALNNLLSMHMNVTASMILAKGVNDWHLADFMKYLLERGVKRINLRSVGAIGDYIDGVSYNLDGLETCLRQALGADAQHLECFSAIRSSREYRLKAVKIQLTEWPDLGSAERGRITPSGLIEPMFESIIINDRGY